MPAKTEIFYKPSSRRPAVCRMQFPLQPVQDAIENENV